MAPLVEHFIVWMRIAALSQFKKLYGVIDVDLPAGDYYLRVQDNYDVSAWEGAKYVGLSKINYLGGTNHNMGICYCLLGLTSAVFMILTIFQLLQKNLKTHLSKKNRIKK